MLKFKGRRESEMKTDASLGFPLDKGLSLRKKGGTFEAISLPSFAAITPPLAEKGKLCHK